MIPLFLKRQLLANDIYLAIAAGCFAFVTGLFTYIIFATMIMLVQFRYDNGLSTQTVDQWMTAIPQWASDAYTLIGTLLLVLLIWAIICAVQRAVALVYLYWQSEQAEKYPLEY